MQQLFPATVMHLLLCHAQSWHEQKQMHHEMQEANLCKVSTWPELKGSVVELRGIGRTHFCLSPVLILQPVGALISFNIEHAALLQLIQQFANIVQHLSDRGHLHGDLSYYNLLEHQGVEDQQRDGPAHRALLVDMQTLMPLQEVPSSCLPLLVSMSLLALCIMMLLLLLCRLFKQSFQLVHRCSWL